MHDTVVIVGDEKENANVGRLVKLVTYIQPMNTIYHEDGFWRAGPEGAWIVTAEDLVRKKNFSDYEIISHLALVKPDECRFLGEDEVLAMNPKSDLFMAFKANSYSGHGVSR
jgi:hypothetical protein